MATEPDREAAEDQALKELGDAIEKYARLTGLEGVCTEWVVVVGSQGFENDDYFSQVGTFTPQHIPYYRTIGLLDYALTRARLKIGKHISDADD